ncbi:uncharacterized protein RSE6_09517 [Rhynchosporium secalis]|uniref:Uncharacterized protein n=1 Tax=Rhynchosporium secalis TaxID=38038 RepID=A0A1E1MI35_RHYSE|nr:uncharacterized protein RSE6_09517 [Rhynchosporium secalis]
MATADENFQPQVGDTTTGPEMHTYIPRSDGSILVNGIAYVRQNVATPVVVTNIPAAAVVVEAPAQVIPPPHPVIYQQPYITQPQPMYAAGSGFAPPYYDIQQQPYPATGYPNFSIHQPDHGATYGYTGGEMLMQNMGQAVHPDFTKKQEMQPSDPDQFRMYWCREPDNTWTQRNRLTIESGDIGDCRWYATDGQFYAFENMKARTLLAL